MDPETWQDFGNWMAERKLLPEPPSSGEAFTNRLLPGEGI